MLVGIDIIDIDRVATALQRTPHMLERVFSPAELDYCMAKKNPYPSLAARFAAREAVRKLDAAFTRGISFHDVEVVHDKNGKPFLYLHEPAREKVKQLGITDMALSLSHSNSQAVAVVIAMRG